MTVQVTVAGRRPTGARNASMSYNSLTVRNRLCGGTVLCCVPGTVLYTGDATEKKTD
jgi:hypothetical protein